MRELFLTLCLKFQSPKGKFSQQNFSLDIEIRKFDQVKCQFVYIFKIWKLTIRNFSSIFVIKVISSISFILTKIKKTMIVTMEVFLKKK